MEWISVKDRLPVKRATVLFFDGDSEVFCLGRINKNNTVTEEGRYVYGVTHWMPLPEPPK